MHYVSIQLFNTVKDPSLLAQVWLDGAVARLVVAPKGAAVVQAALSLHRAHVAPSGAHLTGDQSAALTLENPPCSARQTLLGAHVSSARLSGSSDACMLCAHPGCCDDTVP